jgi:hypothetical protein
MLALVGIYGLTAYSVRQRILEFGIRASRAQILGMRRRDCGRDVTATDPITFLRGAGADIGGSGGSVFRACAAV